ncbi:MAG: hypothetical protein PF904_15555 [Kiritimatiellae bacterium]|jgi:hypothetical protein|nr:hypothetical protein [Kiritimatiellia bacterium]
MINDPIVEEIRKCRKEHAKKYGNDLGRIVEDFREKERLSKRPIVNFGPTPLMKHGRAKQVAETGSSYSVEQ